MTNQTPEEAAHHIYQLFQCNGGGITTEVIEYIINQQREQAVIELFYNEHYAIIDCSTGYTVELDKLMKELT